MALAAVVAFASIGQAQGLIFANTEHPFVVGQPPATFGYPYLELTASHWACADGDPNAAASALYKCMYSEHPGSATYSYDAATQSWYLTVTTFPQWIYFKTRPEHYSYWKVQANPATSELPSLRIRVKIDPKTGALIGVPTDTDVLFRGSVFTSHYAGGPEIVDNDLNGVLLTGRVVQFGSAFGSTPGALTNSGRFNFRVVVTGGLLLDPFGPADPSKPRWCELPLVGGSPWCNVPNPDDLIPSVLDASGMRTGEPTVNFGIDISSVLSSAVTGSFALGPFAGNAWGTAGTLPKPMEQLGVCNGFGVIRGRAWDDLNRNGIQETGEPGLDNVILTLRRGTDQPKTTDTDASGNYAFTQVCDGSSQIDVAGPQFYAASPSNQGTNPNLDSNGSGVMVSLLNGNVVEYVDFGFYKVPPVSSAYTTFTDSAWGAKPKPGNAAKILADYFSLLYPTGEAVIGIPNTAGRYSITVTGAAAMQTFLPQGGLPYKLDRSYVDPAHVNFTTNIGKHKIHLMIGQLAGNVMALKLNIDLSNAGLTRVGLANLKVKSGTYAGKTVAQILALANGAIAGDPQSSLLNYLSLNSVVETINRNFNAGTTDKGFLIQ